MTSTVTPTDAQPTNAHRDASARFLHRLMTSVRMGHRLDDPRNVDVLERWVVICKDLPDAALLTVIPRTLRALLRQPEQGERLHQVCGISPHHPLQHESIAPYIISYRRYQISRGNDPREEKSRRAIEGLRSELRALRQQFNSVFDQMAAVEQERERLSRENGLLQEQNRELAAQNEGLQQQNQTLQDQLAREKLRADSAEQHLQAARDKALRLFRLYLFMLKEERSRLSNDPGRERLLTAEIAVETHAASLEALGFTREAEDHALQILGDGLFREYFHAGPRQERASLRAPAPSPDSAVPGLANAGPADAFRPSPPPPASSPQPPASPAVRVVQTWGPRPRGFR